MQLLPPTFEWCHLLQGSCTTTTKGLDGGRGAAQLVFWSSCWSVAGDEDTCCPAHLPCRAWICKLRGQAYIQPPPPCCSLLHDCGVGTLARVPSSRPSPGKERSAAGVLAALLVKTMARRTLAALRTCPAGPGDAGPGAPFTYSFWHTQPSSATRYRGAAPHKTRPRQRKGGQSNRCCCCPTDERTSGPQNTCCPVHPPCWA
jgi:hypothetical protein